MDPVIRDAMRCDASISVMMDAAPLTLLEAKNSPGQQFGEIDICSITPLVSNVELMMEMYVCVPSALRPTAGLTNLKICIWIHGVVHQ